MTCDPLWKKESELSPCSVFQVSFVCGCTWTSNLLPWCPKMLLYNMYYVWAECIQINKVRVYSLNKWIKKTTNKHSQYWKCNLKFDFISSSKHIVKETWAYVLFAPWERCCWCDINFIPKYILNRQNYISCMGIGNATVQKGIWVSTWCTGYRPFSTKFECFQEIHENCDKSKKKSNSITGLDRPWGFQEVEALRFQDNRHMKVVRLSALRTGRLYPSGSIPGTHFC